MRDREGRHEELREAEPRVAEERGVELAADDGVEIRLHSGQVEQRPDHLLRELDEDGAERDEAGGPREEAKAALLETTQHRYAPERRCLCGRVGRSIHRRRPPQRRADVAIREGECRDEAGDGPDPKQDLGRAHVE